MLSMAASMAAQTLPARAADVIRYTGDADFPPFESLDARGRPQGFQIELLNELGRAIGAEISVSLQPWAQAEASFRAGRADLLAMVDADERRAWALFARSHATPTLAVYRAPTRPDPQVLQDLVGLRIAVLEGEAMRGTLETWLAGVPGPFVRCDGAAAAFAAVREGRADVALVPRAYADPLLASAAAATPAGTAPATELVASRLNLKLQAYAFAVAPGNEALRTRLQRGLDELEQSGRLEALRVRWLSSHRDVAERGALRRGLTRQRQWMWGAGSASVVALAVLGAGLWQRNRRVADETGRRQSAEAQLQRAQELLERAFTLNPEPMLVVERASGVVRDANAALLTLLGVPAPALIGHALADAGHHIDAAALGQLVQSLDHDGALDASPLRLTRADGRERSCLVSADPMTIDAAVNVFCIVRDITEQLERDAELRRAYDALVAELARARDELTSAQAGRARAERSLDEFTRTVAHDLRAPLNAVQGFVGLLQARLRAGHVQEALDYSEHIDRAGRRMSAMVTALSKLSQVSSQPLRRQPVDMNRLVQATWALVRASRPGLTTACRIDELPIAQAEPDLVAQVWQNLLDNAAKYSARVAAPKVSVDSHREGGRTWYRVTDNGAGFDMAKAASLFQPFQRLHASNQFEGVGVGLSLVRRIVDHHGGEIRLRSAPGVGTVAEFTLEAAAVG